VGPGMSSSFKNMFLGPLAEEGTLWWICVLLGQNDSDPGWLLRKIVFAVRKKAGPRLCLSPKYTSMTLCTQTSENTVECRPGSPGLERDILRLLPACARCEKKRQI
jgi:hypothetical protein